MQILKLYINHDWKGMVRRANPHILCNQVPSFHTAVLTCSCSDIKTMAKNRNDNNNLKKKNLSSTLGVMNPFSIQLRFVRAHLN